MRSSLFSSPSQRNRRPQQQQQSSSSGHDASSNKRRNFAFLKYSPKPVNTSMRRTREHAKRIAMQLADDSSHSAASHYGEGATEEDTSTTSSDAALDFQPVRALDQFVDKQRNKSSSTRHSSKSDAGSTISNRSNTRPTFPSNSTMIASNVQQQQRPPYPLTPSKGSSGSQRSWGSSASQKSNHLIHYAQTPKPPIVASPSTPRRTASSSTASSNSSPNLFANVDSAGFSFDAFGLDEGVVDQEVSEAMDFLDSEFPVQNFFSNSRSPSPEEADISGFEDGFRLTGVSGMPISMHIASSCSTSSQSSSQNNKAEEVQEREQLRAKEWALFGKQEEQTGKVDESFEWGAEFSSLDKNSFVSFGANSFVVGESEVSTDVGVRSDVGVMSDVAPSDSSVFDELPPMMEIPTTKPKKSSAKSTSPASLKFEEKKQESQDTMDDVSEEMIRSWSERSPVKHTEFWGEDIMPEEAPHQRQLSASSSIETSDMAEPVHTFALRTVVEKPPIIQQQRNYQQEQQPAVAAELTHTQHNYRQHQQHPAAAPETPEQQQRAREYNYQNQQHPAVAAELEHQQHHNHRQRQEHHPAPETPEQKRRARECGHQRTSLDSLKSRLKQSGVNKPKMSAQSDIVVGGASPELSAVLNRVRNHGDAQSEIGVAQARPFVDVSSMAARFEKPSSSKESVPKAPKPRANGYLQKSPPQSNHYSPGSYQQPNYNQQPKYEQARGVEYDDYDRGNDQGYEDQRYYDDEYADDYYDDQYDDDYDQQDRYSRYQYNEDQHPQQDSYPRDQYRHEHHAQEYAESSPEKPRKMTYRERREIELQREREEKAKQEATQDTNKVDVAAQIRKRIATNKRMAASSAHSDSGGEDINGMRNRLKKVSMESKITQFKAPAEKPAEHTPEFMRKTLKKVSIPPPELSYRPQSGQLMPGTVIQESVFPTVTPSVSSVTSSPLQQRTHQLPQAEEPARNVDAPSPMSAVHEIIARRAMSQQSENRAVSAAPEPVSPQRSIAETTGDTKNKLNAFLANRLTGGPNLDPASGPSADDAQATLMRSLQQKQAAATPVAVPAAAAPVVSAPTAAPPSTDGRPALKKDPKYDRYFRMLKVGMPMEVVKHAMTRDGIDASVMDGDHNKPAGYGAGVPLKEDPKYTKYFKMLKIGLPMGAVQNAMERDGVDSSVMDGDHNLPANQKKNGEAGANPEENNKQKDTHRRTRLHWETKRQVNSNSLWAKIDEDAEIDKIEIDEDEFAELFQAELTPAETKKSRHAGVGKKGAAVRVIDSKRANNGGIILARLKMTHDEMADAVDRIDHEAMSTEQMQNIIEYLPTADERKSLEAYMLSGGTDAAEKFDGLCECEKFMVAMMTVKHAKRKVRALLFNLQFKSCLDSLVKDANVVETACDELSNSVRLRKLLGIVLNVGNRINTAGVSGKTKAGSFTLDSLLKLSHAKAFDKKTTFLHYIVLVVQRNNELLLRFKDDLPTVLKADRVYWDQVVQDLEEVENQLENVRRIALHQALIVSRHLFKNKPAKSPGEEEDDDSLNDATMSLEEEVEALRSTEIGIFTLGAIKKVSSLRDKVDTVKTKFVGLLEYFGEDDKQDMQPHELFNILSTFCRNFEKAKEEVAENQKKKKREERVKRSTSEPRLKTGVKPKSPSRQNSTPVLRASALQPTMSKVVNDVNGRRSQAHSTSVIKAVPGKTAPPASRRPPPNGVHNRDPHTARRPPPKGPRPRRPNGVHPPQRPNGYHTQQPPNGAYPPQTRPRGPDGSPRPPAQQQQPKAPRPSPPSARADPPASAARSSHMSPAMRQKVKQRRHQIANRYPSSVNSNATESTYNSSSATPPAGASAYTRVDSHSVSDLSPRSNIRQKRRQERTRPADWPLDEGEMEFALD